jgi:hypothetical protein
MPLSPMVAYSGRIRLTITLSLNPNRLYPKETSMIETPNARTWYRFVFKILNPNIPDSIMAAMIIPPAGVKCRLRQFLTR